GSSTGSSRSRRAERMSMPTLPRRCSSRAFSLHWTRSKGWTRSNAAGNDARSTASWAFSLPSESFHRFHRLIPGHDMAAEQEKGASCGRLVKELLRFGRQSTDEPRRVPPEAESQQDD